jgi:hypothetical protein
MITRKERKNKGFRKKPFDLVAKTVGRFVWRGLLYKVLTFFEVPIDNKIP